MEYLIYYTCMHTDKELTKLQYLYSVSVSWLGLSLQRYKSLNMSTSENIVNTYNALPILQPTWYY